MTLKLDVPWREGPLPVDCEVPAKIKNSSSEHVRIDGDDVLVADFFGLDNRVPDVSRYSIGVEGGRVEHHICANRHIVRHDDIREPEFSPQCRSILLLLESPHKDEYDDNCIKRPLAPANGRTGKNIDQCLSTVLFHIHVETGLIEPGHHVVISNPIQFQTSLYVIHEQKIKGKWKSLRDSVWQSLWREDCIRENFGERLNAYNPSLIINACTQDLKSDVRDFVEDWFNQREQVPLYEVAHPASWRTPLRPKYISP